jgi:hypothetical protein
MLGGGLLSVRAAEEKAESRPAVNVAPAEGRLVRAQEKDAKWVEKERAAYPLTTCVVSGVELEGGGMGGPVEFVYEKAGQPDRLVRFCCRHCLSDFKKDPEKYLGEIAAARAKRPQ